MYFNNEINNTNIDKDFNNENNNEKLSKILEIINKYKKFIIIGLIIIIITIIVLILVLSKPSKQQLNIEGESTITIYQGTDYIEPGYSAYNSKKEDITNEVNIQTTLNTNVLGEYEIIYTLGNIKKIRNVLVIEKPKEYTSIRLTAIDNSKDIYLKVGEKYTEPGYMVFNSSGKDFNDKVTITGTVDTSKKGKYKLTYSVIDSNNVEVTATRNVYVIDTEINLTLSPETYTNGKVNINVGIIDSFFEYMILPDGTKVTNTRYSYSVYSNGKYTFTTYNKSGSKTTSIEVKNIDKTPPTGSCKGTYKNGTSNINITASDNSGINKYVINGVSYNKNNITINKELKNVTITIYDKAGNTKNISCTLQNQNNTSNNNSTPSNPSSNNTTPNTGNNTNNNDNNTSNNNGIFPGTKYNLTEKQLKGIAMLCQREQGTNPVGTAAEASLIANKFELNGGKYKGVSGGTGLYNYVRKVGWWANAASHMDNQSNLKSNVLEAVRDVLVNGNRTLPHYVNEHDCINCGSYGYDITKIVTNGKVITNKKELLNRNNYIRDNTVIYNKYGSVYTFYSFPTSTSDPFGYTESAKKKFDS